MEWTPIGSVTLDRAGRLGFPQAPKLPGLYRFRVRAAGKEGVYIGETENLSRRFAHYRNPGPRQETNIRLNTRFREALAAGAEIVVSTVTEIAWMERLGRREPADFSAKAVRRLFENAALLEGGQDIEALNH